MTKLIVFDLDGVLIDTPDMHFETFKKSLEYNTEITLTKREHDIEYNGLSTKKKLAILKEKHNMDDKLCERIWLQKQIYTNEYIDNCVKEDPEKIKLMQFLASEGYKIACASNAIRSSVVKILEKIGILDFFNLVLSNEDVQNCKPSPEIYLCAMIAMDASPSNTLIVEDSKVGYESAIATRAEVLRVVNSKEVTIDTLKNKLDKIENKYMKQKYENNELTIVIPMAGAGSRFEVAGYTFPKPLIEVNGKPMIQLVAECLNINANYVFIVREEHNLKYNIGDFLKTFIPNAKIITTDGLTEGAACTVLLAEEFMTDGPIIIANSDQFIEWDSFEFMKHVINNNLDASILTFNATHPKWSFAKVNEEGLVTEVAEKKPISNIATVGIYYWKHGSDFARYAKEMISKNIRVNNEFYVCPVFNEAIADNKKIGIFNVDEMWGLGTPEDLNYFLDHRKQ